MSDKSDSRLGAAILGMYAAIKLCVAEGVSPDELLELVRPVAEADLKRDGGDPIAPRRGN